MIDLQNSQVEVGQAISVQPSNRLFEELGNNTYEYEDLLSELIDNSIAARLADKTVEITVTIGISAETGPERLVVKDNAVGISHDRLGETISPASLQNTDSLNEHGLGMKQAIAGLGKLRHLITKTADTDKAVAIERFQFGDILPKLISVPWEHGTEIAIEELKPVVKPYAVSYGRDIVPKLGARYRRFLVGSSPKARIQIEMVDINDDDKILNSWPLEPIGPVYFHRMRRINAPMVDHKTFRGADWSAELTFGYAPENYEWEALGMDMPGRYEPYAVTLRKQGLDIIMNDRVIMFHQLYQLGFIETPHNNYNRIRGEIVLKKGFSTAITKNAIAPTEQWQECKEKIKEFLQKGKYIEPTPNVNPDDIPEAALRDRMAVWLSTNPLLNYTSVHKEYHVEALGGRIDILADQDVWEIKPGDANGMDVWQLFAYMDMTNKNKGYLLAKSFRDSALATKEHITQKHQVDITLTNLSDYPINQPLSETEINKY